MDKMKFVPNITLIDNTIEKYSNDTMKIAATIMVLATIGVPVFIMIVYSLAEESFDVSDATICAIIGVVLGAILTALAIPAIKRKSQQSNDIAKATYIILEDDCLRGAAIQPNSTINGQQIDFSKVGIYGVSKIEEFNISYKQVIDFQTFTIQIPNLDYGRCFTIHTSKASYTFVAMNEEDINIIQKTIRAKCE